MKPDLLDLERRVAVYGYDSTRVTNGFMLRVGKKGALGTFVAPTLEGVFQAALDAIDHEQGRLL